MCYGACRSGSIRLMSLHWYVHQRPVHVSMLRMADRQKLEALKPSPYLSHREAEAAIRSASRRVLVLTYGRGCPDEPDPTGEVLKSLDRFVDWFIREFSLTPKDLKSYGLFWDFPSIVQRPQTADQERQRGNALDVMARLYASPLATCVLQHVSVPTRPRDFEAKLLVFGVPATVTAEEVITPAETPYGRRDHVVVEKRDDGAWLMTFDTHEAALHAEVAVKRWAAKFDGGFATHAYNDRPYGERGWCILEESLCREVVGRSQQRGFEEVHAAMENCQIAKLYEISGAGTPVPIRVEKPQDPKEVAEAIRSEWPSTLNPCKQKELTGAEAEMIAGFSCLKAQCYKPSDRAMLLRKIREQWGSEQEFDRFVQTELVRVIAESKAVYQGQLRANAAQSFEYVFGD